MDSGLPPHALQVSPTGMYQISTATSIRKVISIASFRVQAVFCAISGSRDISKTKWGMKLEELEILLKYLQENIDLAALKKILSKDNPSKSPNSKSICSQNTSSNNWKRKLCKKHFFTPRITFLCRAIFFARNVVVQYFVFLKSDTPFCFTHISAPRYRTKNCLYSKRSYGCHLSNKICPSLLAYM